MNLNIRLDEYCESVRDGTHDTPKPTPEGFHLVTSKAIKNNKIDFDSCYFISEEDYIKINKRSKVDKWDVLMTMIGTVGRLLLVKDNPNYAIKNIALFKVNDEYKAKWLYYYLSTKNVQDYFEMIASGTSQHFIGLGHLRKLKINDYHAGSKQIVDILSVYDNLIENNNKRIKLLEQMAENLYKEWFVRFRFPGYENAEFENGLPKGWEYVKFDDILSFDRGISYSSEEIDCEDGLNLINLKNIDAFGGFRRDGTKKYNGKYKESQVVKKGDLVIGVTDMTQDRRTVGAAALIPTIKGTSVISADLVKVVSDIPNIYLYCLCRYGFYSKYFSQFANGANVLHLKPGALLNKKVLLPTKDLIEAFVEKASAIIELIDELNLANDNLIKQRDLLLPRLMSGKLKVGKTTENIHKAKVISFEQFVSNMGMAARAKSISNSDLIAMYEAYIDDDATE